MESQDHMVANLKWNFNWDGCIVMALKTWLKSVEQADGL
jgi:hypothetical protein